jgi:heptosyltransferase-2/heptosyltransferase-3
MADGRFDATPAPPLVVRFGSLGDLVQLTVLLEPLARASGGRCDLVTGHPAAGTLLRGLPYEVGAERIASRRAPYLLSSGQRRLVGRLRRAPPRLVCLFEAVAAVRPRLLRLLRRGGIEEDAILDLTELDRGALEHTVDFLRRALDVALERLGAAEVERPQAPRLAVSEPELEECRRWLAARELAERPLTVLQVSSRRATRGRWPVAHWAALARAILAAAPDARVLVAGTADERADADAVVAAAGDPRVRSAAGELPLRRLIALLARADGLVGIDSGPAHLAAAVGCPQVVLFGRADPRRVAPRGSAAVEIVTALPRARWPDDPAEWAAVHRLAEIELEEVVAAWTRLPRGRSRP